ncbi:hypothetical protein H5410_020559 [Solanum commersonii]|uniref:Uncharacterized protein n=1 Tax=Solanum commersonii TaxID=4109 RepID=A0A9J5ZEJ9_SOLCO|nr:hypothetical protein H5410_020559 [Solanum commersonii]
MGLSYATLEYVSMWSGNPMAYGSGMDYGKLVSLMINFKEGVFSYVLGAFYAIRKLKPMGIFSCIVQLPDNYDNILQLSLKLFG